MDRQDSLVEAGVFVTTGDITNCPYRVIGPVTANMKLSLTYGGSDEGALRKLGRKGAKLGADAVVLVTIGKGRITLMSWNSRPVTGRAVKFVDASCAPR